MFENYIFCYFCSNLFKKCDNLNGRYNFFCICCLARLNIYVGRLLLYFQKNKKFLKLGNFIFKKFCALMIDRNKIKCFFWLKNSSKSPWQQIFHFLGCGHAFFCHKSRQRCSQMLKIFFSTAFDLKLTKTKNCCCGKQKSKKKFEKKKKMFFFFKNSSKSLPEKNPLK